MTLEEKFKQSVREYWSIYERLKKENRLKGSRFNKNAPEIQSAARKLERNWLIWAGSEEGELNDIV